MAQEVIYETPGGKVVAYDETDEERAERRSRAAQAAADRLRISISQRNRLADLAKLRRMAPERIAG